jgi:DNA-binding NarL/FixJ family response regulator
VGAIQDRFPSARILAVAERFPEKDALSLIGLGVKGLVRYDELREKLPAALDAVAHGGFWVSRALVSRFLDQLSGHPRRGRLAAETSSLSGREREVLDLILMSLSNKEIGTRLHISERTVKFHVSNLLAKFRSTSRWELVLRCLPLSKAGSRDS